MHQQQTAFENIVGKGEIARDEQFLLFPQCFLLNQIIVSPFFLIFYIISADFEEPKIGISSKRLQNTCTSNTTFKRPLLNCDSPLTFSCTRFLKHKTAYLVLFFAE